VVEENMAAAARVHAVERGRDVRRCTLVAFGGAAPLHACRLADKLGIDHIIVPAGAGVGSAIGFLRAPVSYEAVRTCYQRLDAFDGPLVGDVLRSLSAEATGVVSAAAPAEETVTACRAAMRYVGQGHEVDVDIPLSTVLGGLAPDPGELHARFEKAYHDLFTRTIPNLAVEVLSWVVTVSTVVEEPARLAPPDWSAAPAAAAASRRAFEAADARWATHAVHEREALAGVVVHGPALVVEEQTTTVVGAAFRAALDGAGNLVLMRRAQEDG
jgi:N-methylhydantoinase A